MGPQLRVARRNDIGVPGETEVRPLCADPRIKVVDWRYSFLLETQAMTGEAQRLQHIRKCGKRATVFRGDGTATDKRLAEFYRVGHRLRCTRERRYGQSKPFREEI